MQVKPSGARRLRLVAVVLGWLVSLLIVGGLGVMRFGVPLLRHPLERWLTAQLGRTVTIGALRRTDRRLFDATVVIEDLRVAQPDWVGGGDFARVLRAEMRLAVLPLLHGAVRPQTLAIDGLAIRLVRKDRDHSNWKGIGGGKGGRGGAGGGTLRHLAIRSGKLIFDDYKRDHFFTARIAADDRALSIVGKGTLIGRPTTIQLRGAPPLGGGRWPFRLAYRSAIANTDMVGLADRPLDLGGFDATAHAWGDDLKHLDLLVEAGLPGTAPVDLTAVLRHDRPDWRLRSFAATIGRSHVAGALEIRKRDGRTIVAGKVAARALDFDDLANAEGRARAAAKRAAAPGRRLPDTRIDLSRLLNTDARIEVAIHRLLFRKPSAFRSMAGTLTLDRGTLTLEPFTVGLIRGTLAGKAVVRQQGAVARLALDLRLRGARIEAMATDSTAFSGALDGRFVLAGRGNTIRDALGAASGRFALVGRDGTMSRQVALLLGQDIGRGALADKNELARLRCGIGSFVLSGGRALPHPLLIDTSVTRAEGTGMLDLAHERIDLSLSGAPKQASALRLAGPIRVTGALFSPTVTAPQATSTRGILATIGRALSGRHAQPLAGDADCAGLAARALR